LNGESTISRIARSRRQSLSKNRSRDRTIDGARSTVPVSLRSDNFFAIVCIMRRREFLGGFELLVLSALMRLGDEAYGVPIADAIAESSGREVALGSVYVTLDRLSRKGLVSSRIGEPTAERGGRAKTYFRVTAKGLREVRQARQTLKALWDGSPQLEGGTA
jgi:PadR family transcriptional regulator PadR